TILQDSRILDLRAWNPTGGGRSDTTSLVYGYRRLRVLKDADNHGNGVLRMSALATHPESQFRFPPQQFPPRLRRMYVENPTGQDTSCYFELIADLSKLPGGQIADIIYEHYSPGVFLRRGENSTTITLHSELDAAEVTRWFVMPRGRDYRSFQILRYETGKPATAEIVRGFTEFLAED